MKKALAALALLAVGAAVGVGVTYLALDDGEDGPGGTSAAAPTDDGTGSVGGSCGYADTSGCVPGAEIELTDGEWTCDQPLASYARSLGGELPLKVTARFTRPVETVAGIVDLTSGCTGDGTDGIDLILDIQGDGRTVGGTGDALTVKIEATDIDITGSIDCGPRGPGGPGDRKPRYMGPRLPGDKGPQARPKEKALTHNPFAALAAKLEGGTEGAERSTEAPAETAPETTPVDTAQVAAPQQAEAAPVERAPESAPAAEPAPSAEPAPEAGREDGEPKAS